MVVALRQYWLLRGELARPGARSRARSNARPPPSRGCTRWRSCTAGSSVPARRRRAGETHLDAGVRPVRGARRRGRGRAVPRGAASVAVVERDLERAARAVRRVGDPVRGAGPARAAGHRAQQPRRDRKHARRSRHAARYQEEAIPLQRELDDPRRALDQPPQPRPDRDQARTDRGGQRRCWPSRSSSRWRSATGGDRNCLQGCAELAAAPETSSELRGSRARRWRSSTRSAFDWWGETEDDYLALRARSSPGWAS
jgi:hypothetical protein